MPDSVNVPLWLFVWGVIAWVGSLALIAMMANAVARWRIAQLQTLEGELKALRKEVASVRANYLSAMGSPFR